MSTEQAWDSRILAGTSAWELAAVGPQRVMVLQESQWVDLTLNA